MKTKAPKHRNAVAHELRTNKLFRHRVIVSKKLYSRKTRNGQE